MSVVLKFIEYPGNISLCMQIERSQLKRSVGYALRHCVAIITCCKNRSSAVKTDGNIRANNISINLKIAIKKNHTSFASRNILRYKKHFNREIIFCSKIKSNYVGFLF